jgi:hypothetical protein
MHDIADVTGGFHSLPPAALRASVTNRYPVPTAPKTLTTVIDAFSAAVVVIVRGEGDLFLVRDPPLVIVVGHQGR